MLPAARAGRDAKKKLIIAAAWAFDPEGFDGGEEYTPSSPLRDDSFVVQAPAGVRWLNVHPRYLVRDGEWDVVRLALRWRDGMMPGPGGVQDQAAWTVAAIDIVLEAWAKLQADRDRNKEK